MVVRIVPGVTVFCFALSSLVSAAEPYQEFVRGLRDRGYFDLAETYLRQIENDPATPQDVRVLLPFEKGLILLERSRTLRNPEARARQLDAAEALFEEFVAGAPDHPLRAEANTERGGILLNKARLMLWQADALPDASRRKTLQKQAREHITQAAKVYRQARDEHEAAWEQVKGFIPENETARRAERDRVEGAYMQAQVDLTRCIYEEAQTYDAGSAERIERLNRAAAEFEAIHHRYRTQVAGLHARLWQGKCFEELGEVRKALGVYDEILRHPGEQIRALQDRARWFRLICLNHESRGEHQLVVEEATRWRQEAADRLHTLAGLGIQYELARAQLAVAQSKPDVSPVLKTDLLKKSLDNARTVARFAGPLKAPAVALAQQLMAKLNRQGAEPKDFDTAVETANVHLEDARRLNTQLSAARSAGETAEVERLQQELLATAAEMRRLYDLALKLATDRDDPERRHIAGFRLAYAYFLEQRFLEAGVMGRYVARLTRQEFPEIAVESAYLALAAFEQMFAETDASSRDFEKHQVLEVAQFITSTWPDSDRSADAQIAVARMLRQAGQPLEAAEWYAQVPRAASQFADAQLGAGQSYWNAFLTRSALPDDQRPPADELAQWMQLAEEHLSAGVQLRQQQLPQGAATPDDLVLGKLSLVQIRNRQGVYASTGDTPGALALLQDPPHSVMAAVAVPDDQQRPTTPGAVKSLPIAVLAYQQLLRAQIGVHDLEGARQTRERLEAMAGEEDAGALTQVYVAFGRELEQELEQLRAAGDTQRLEDVRDGFESFLDDLFKRTEGQTFNSLLWIAETYAGLAEGSADDAAKSAGYFERAADAYAAILNRHQAAPEFVKEPGHVIGVQLRLVNCRRRQGEFAAADQIMQQILRARPNAVDAQMEAARLYEEWAAATPADAAPRLRTAIEGRPDAGPMWGWAEIAQKLQRAIDHGEELEDYHAKHLEARFHLNRCRFALAQQQTAGENRDRLLNDVRFGIQRLIAITGEMPEADWQRFNDLYQQTLVALGEPAKPLARRTGSGQAQPTAVLSARRPVAAPVTAAVDGSSSSAAGIPPRRLALMALFIVLGLSACGGIYFMTIHQDRKRRARLAALARANKREQPPPKVHR